jgi:hypothetical protein
MMFNLFRLQLFLTYKNNFEPGAMAHTCNPSYWGGRDGKDCRLRLGQAKNVKPYLKNN